MKTMMKLIYCIFLLSCVSPKYSQQQPIPVEGYRLYWNDEFDGKSLNKTKWGYRGLGKRDDAYITAESVKLDGKGHLIMEVFKRNDSVFTSMISTVNIFETTYGYFECRVKFTHTPGTFPSFWLQSPTINTPNGTPEKDGAEIDIFEYYPHLNKDHVSHAMHWGGYGASHRMEGPIWGKLDNTADDFHTIGFEWTEKSYTTFVDGKKTFTGNQLISHVPEFLILSVGVSKTAAGPLKVENLPDQFMVDYIRVYKKK
jgi:beta-glucanase (GH16 family)